VFFRHCIAPAAPVLGGVMASQSFFFKMMQREPVVMWSCAIGGVGASARAPLNHCASL